MFLSVCVLCFFFLLQSYSIQPECVVTNEHWQRQTRCLSAHHNRRMLKRLAISVMPQSLLSKFNTFAHQKGQTLHEALLSICIGMQAQHHHLPHGDK